MNDYGAMVRQLMMMAQPVADKHNPLAEQMNPLATTEGARGYSGGRGGPTRYSAAQMSDLAAKNMQETKLTYGVHETTLPNGAGVRVVVQKRGANSRGAHRGSHLTSKYVYRDPAGGDWKSVTQAEFLSLLGD
jgi:hypothetical protein